MLKTFSFISKLNVVDFVIIEIFISIKVPTFYNFVSFKNDIMNEVTKQGAKMLGQFQDFNNCLSSSYKIVAQTRCTK